MSKQLQTVEMAHSLDFCCCLNEMKKKYIFIIYF